MQSTNTIKAAHLSSQQARLWSLQQRGVIYSVQCTVLLHGILDHQAFQRGYQKVVRDHEILHTLFRSIKSLDRPMQIIDENTAGQCSIIDLCTLGISDKTIQLIENIQYLQHATFDLAYGPIIHARLFYMSHERHILLLCIPAICGDNATLPVLISRLRDAYQHELHGDRPLSDDDDILQYVDVCSWQEDLLTDIDASHKQDYWRQFDLAAISSSRLPFVNMSDPTFLARIPEKVDNAVFNISLSSSYIKILLDRINQLNVDISSYILSCWKIVISRLTNKNDIVIGIACDGRHYEELIGALGLYSRVVPMRTVFDAQQTFTQLVYRVRAILHQTTAVQEYFSWHEIDPNAQYHLPLSYAYEVWPDNWQVDGGDWHLSLSSGETEPFTVKLHVLQIGDNKLYLSLHYNAAIMRREQIQRLAMCVQTLLLDSLQQPDAYLQALRLLPEEEEQRLEKQGQGPTRQWVWQPWHRMIEQWAQQRPDSIALSSKEGYESYGHLNACANRLADVLHRQGIGRSQPVVIYLKRGRGQVLALLAVIKAGGCYVIVEPEQPLERTSMLINDIEPTVILTEVALQERVRTMASCVLLVEQESQMVHYSQEDRVVEVQDDDVACVIYTSGSTGRPKGVMVTHQGVSNYTRAIAERLKIQPGWRYGLVTTLAADLGNTMLYSALANGGCLCLLDYETVTTNSKFQQQMEQEYIEILKIVPSHLRALLDGGIEGKGLPREVLVLGGERLGWDLVQKVRATGGQCRIYNHYGPTETTVGVLVREIEIQEEGSTQESVPLGEPLANTQVYVVDTQGHQVPAGCEGEIWIGGAGVSKGYWKRSEETAEKFVQHERCVGKMYRTGDRARKTEEAELIYIGRMDRQVKIRGYRVELSEIEERLIEINGINEAIVVAYQSESGETELRGYLVGEEDITSEKVKTILREKIPHYMIPGRLLKLKCWPLTKNGKVDKQKLEQDDIDPQFIWNDISSQQNTLLEIRPRDTIELQLLQIWEALLDQHPISITDSFFDVGGHSILAVRLMALIQKYFDYNLPLATLFQHPTIADLALIIRQHSIPQRRQALVLIQKQGTSSPFFCVHPSGGNVFCYTHLARYLGKNQPFYGLQNPELTGEKQYLESIEALAAHYIIALQNIQPHGPYSLGGWSLGGLIAFEMAQQLRRQGQSIKVLAIIDSTLPEHSNTDEGQTGYDLTDTHLADVIFQLFHLPIPEEEDFQQLSGEEKLAYALSQGQKQRLIPEDTTLEQIRFFIGLHEVNINAAQRYRPCVYPGAVDLFLSEDSLDIKDTDGEVERERTIQEHTLEWRKLAEAGLNVHIISGTHQGIVEEPSVRMLASTLQACLQREEPANFGNDKRQITES